MVNINVQENCGNSPKILFLKDFIVSIVTNERSSLSDNITEDIKWDNVGGQCFSGKKDVLSELQIFRNEGVIELTVNTIVTHGYNGVVDGMLKFEDGKRLAFCDVYSFSSSKNNSPVKMIKTYTTILL